MVLWLFLIEVYWSAFASGISLASGPPCWHVKKFKFRTLTDGKSTEALMRTHAVVQKRCSNAILDAIATVPSFPRPTSWGPWVTSWFRKFIYPVRSIYHKHPLLELATQLNCRPTLVGPWNSYGESPFHRPVWPHCWDPAPNDTPRLPRWASLRLRWHDTTARFGCPRRAKKATPVGAEQILDAKWREMM